MDLRRVDPADQRSSLWHRTYQSYLGAAAAIEARLLQSAQLKQAGWTNDEIRQLETEGLSPAAAELRRLGNTRVLATTGAEGALVYRVQQYLTSLGYKMPVDGVFRDETRRGLIDYQQAHKLYPSGSLDEATFYHLSSTIDQASHVPDSSQ
ncbi:MAG: hypothetical protein OHK0039_12440 [Bacteroidia bacterium]